MIEFPLDQSLIGAGWQEHPNKAALRTSLFDDIYRPPALYIKDDIVLALLENAGHGWAGYCSQAISLDENGEVAFQAERIVEDTGVDTNLHLYARPQYGSIPGFFCFSGESEQIDHSVPLGVKNHLERQWVLKVGYKPVSDSPNLSLCRVEAKVGFDRCTYQIDENGLVTKVSIQYRCFPQRRPLGDVREKELAAEDLRGFGNNVLPLYTTTYGKTPLSDADLCVIPVACRFPPMIEGPDQESLQLLLKENSFLDPQFVEAYRRLENWTQNNTQSFEFRIS